MSYPFSIFLLIFSCYLTIAQVQKFHVINLQGAALYQQPTFEALILDTIPVGKNLHVQVILETDETRRIAPDFSLPGNWIGTKSR